MNYLTNYLTMTLESLIELDNFKLSVKELKAKSDRLAYIQFLEYTTRGNTPKCQRIFDEIAAIDKEIERRNNSIVSEETKKEIERRCKR